MMANQAFIADEAALWVKVTDDALAEIGHPFSS